jgi:MYXO-CTERM domain-containing protein
MARHDPHRTGQAIGASDIQQPVAYWKRYIGGNLPATSLVVADVDDNGVSEFLMIIGGHVVAKTRSDSELWRSDNLQLTELVGLADLDDRGGEELVVRSSDRAFVLDAATGATLWSEPAGEMGTIGGTRLGDVSGDGLPDLVVGECGCCRVRSNTAGVAYSFGQSASAPTALWEMPVARCGGHLAMTLVNTGGGGYDLLTGDTTELVLLDGRTGAEKARTPVLGTRVQQSSCVPVNIDGAAGEELVCVRNDRNAPTERAVFALRYTGAALAVMWTRPLEAADTGAASWVDLVDDLDGDGAPEVIVAASPDGADWTTYVLDAATGNLRDTLAGALVTGAAPVGTGGVLVTAAGLDLTGWTLGAAGLTQAWTIPDAIAPLTVDLTRARRSSIATSATVARVDGDERKDLVAKLRSSPNTIVGYAVSASAASELARFTLPADVEAQQMFPLDVVDPDLQLAVAHNDGFLTVFDRALNPARPTDDDVGQVSLQTGGYYASGFLKLSNTPRVARLDATGPDRILQVDSRGALAVLDGAQGSFAAPPRLLWSAPASYSPAVVDGLANGDRGVAVLALDQPLTSPPSHSVVALDGTGATVWRQPAPNTPVNDIVAGNLDGDEVPDLVLQWGDPSDVLLRTRALAGTDGHALWDATPVDPGAGRKPRGVAIAAFDGDALDDVFHQAQRTQVLSGATGTEIGTSGPGTTYFMPTLRNLDSDPRLEVVLHGGPRPVSVLDDDLAPLLTSPDENDPFPDAAIAACPGNVDVLVEASERNGARLKVTDLSGGNAGRERTVVLAAGRTFADELSAQEAVALLGQLTTATVHADLTGLGRPTALLGSSDGWLYAIDPCALALDWSYDFQSAVGEAVTGDTDGDGRDEIIVTVQDGYLYLLRNFELAAPPVVADTDPYSDASEDLAELSTESTLEATWTGVGDAVRYEVAVVDAAGNYVGTPWRDAGAETTLTITDLPLVDGFYRVSVRAYGSDGHVSVDTVSNGLWVTVGPPGNAVSDGCGCRSNEPANAALVLLVAFGLARRRRRLASCALRPA